MLEDHRCCIKTADAVKRKKNEIRKERKNEIRKERKEEKNNKGIKYTSMVTLKVLNQV